MHETRNCGMQCSPVVSLILYMVITAHITLYMPGKVSEWNEERTKVFTMSTKLNDKTVEKLGGADGQLDLGILEHLKVGDSKIKEEFPSAEPLAELLKNCKPS